MPEGMGGEMCTYKCSECGGTLTESTPPAPQVCPGGCGETLELQGCG